MPKICSVTQILLCLALVFVISFECLAQEAARPDRGIMPNGSYSFSDIENINLLNGNVNLSIPLASLPPIAGGKLSWTVTAQYNSKIWDITREQRNENPLSWQPYIVDKPGVGGGWSIGSAYHLFFRNANEDLQRLSYPPNSGLQPWELDLLNNHEWYKVVLQTPDGAEHEFRPLGHTSYTGGEDFLRGFFHVIPSGTAMRYYSVDGTYMFARITTEFDWTIYMLDGTQIIQTPDGIQRIQDTNGNKIKIFSDDNGAHFQDEQTGREIRVTYNASGQGQYQVWYNTVKGVQQHIDINMGTTQVQGKFYQINQAHCPVGITRELSTQMSVVREIVLPSTQPGEPQRRFTFNYNSDTSTTATDLAVFNCPDQFQNHTRTVSHGLGQLSRIVTPSGSIVDYSYTYDGVHSFVLSGIGDHIALEKITQKKITHDGTEEIWTYSIGESGGLVTAPDGSVSGEVAYCSVGCATNKSGLTYRSIRPFTKIERHWINLTFSDADINAPGGVIAFNPVVDKEYTTLTDAKGKDLKMSAKVFSFDYNGNVTQEIHYDWFDPALVARDSEDVPTGVPAGATVLKTINHSHYNQAASASSANVYAKRSVPGSPLILNAPKETILGSSIVQFGYDGQPYGVAPTVGNLTTKKTWLTWLDVEARWITTSNTYGPYGNIATSTDARGKVTEFFYDDATHALPNRVVVDPQNGTGTQTTAIAFDYSTGLVTSQTDVNGQVSTIDYTNQLLGTVDPFGRPGITKSPVVNIEGANHQRCVTTTYLDATRQVIVETDLNIENDKLLKTRITVDMLGRPELTETTEDGTNYTISFRNKYLNMGQVTLTSGPMRSTAASTDSWTRVTKDTAGRVKEVATFGGATQPAWSGTAGVFTGAVTTDYTANFTTVTDQAGKVRRSMVDALGRLVRVDEPDLNGNLGSTDSPVQKTEYEYDVFDNLKKVIQGTQERTFDYDSLSRLHIAINPESGRVDYQYDDNGNLIVKTDARTDPNDQNKKVSTHFEYDALNRVTRRWYNGSDSTSATIQNSPTLPPGVGFTNEVKFYYDSQQLPAGAPSYSHGSAVGRLVAQTYGSGSNGDYYGYDVLGRQKLKIQQTGSVNYIINAEYTLSGAVRSLTYPSRNTITNSFDQAGRLITFSGNLGGGAPRTYSNGILYSATGGLEKEQFGTATSIYNKLFYNSRGQLAEIRASTSYTGPTDYSADRGAIINNYSDQCSGICVGSSMTDNNGNLRSQEVLIPGYPARFQPYTYDALNRLRSASEAVRDIEYWHQQFTYDRWGNRTIDVANTFGKGINNKAFTVNTNNNRLDVPSGQPGVMIYDNVGNLVSDTYSGDGIRTYDAENKITLAWRGSTQAQLYSYDASGQRIKRTVDAIETWQIYGFGGELLAEYPANGNASNPQKEYGYRNGQLLVTAQPVSGFNGYANRRRITIDHTKVPNTNQTDFPMLFSGTFTYLKTTANGGDVTNSSGFDIIFTSDATGLNQLDHEIESYSPTTGAVNFWIRIPTLATATDTVIYMHYGNSSITTSHEAKPGVWDSHFALVAHLGNGTTLSAADSTANAQSPTITGPTATSGKIGGGADFNVTFARLIYANQTLLRPTTSMTISSWFKRGRTGTHDEIACRTNGNTNAGSAYALDITSGNKLQFSINNGSGWRTAQYATSFTDTTNFHYAVGTFDGTTLTLYLDGAQVATFSFTGSINNPNESLFLGVVRSSTANDWQPGVLDEFRLSYHHVRSADWIATEYNNQSSPETFYTLSPAVNESTDVRWLIADHLDTPRMIFDQTGSLANVRRHDYLPFGEELSAPVGERSAEQGYTTGDGVRQQFTQKERDIETGLDFFEARYYGSTQGRFTSPDPLLSSGTVEEPQSWNRYSYVLNNPLNLIDPYGLYVFDKNVSEGERKKFNAALAQARANLQQVGKTYGTKSGEYKKAERALNAYGAEGKNNGVTIYTQAGLGHNQTQTAGVPGPKTADNTTGQDIRVTFDKKYLDSDLLGASIGHEGVHVANGSDWVNSGFSETSNPLLYQAEVDAFTVQGVIGETLRPNGYGDLSLPSFKEPGKNPYLPEKTRLFDSGWAVADRATLRRTNIDKFLSRPGKARGYGLTPASTEREFLRGSRFRR